MNNRAQTRDPRPWLQAMAAAAAVTAILVAIPTSIQAYADPEPSTPTPTPTSTVPVLVAKVPDPGPGLRRLQQTRAHRRRFVHRNVHAVGFPGHSQQPGSEHVQCGDLGRWNPAVNVVAALDGGPYVVFAPTDDAFAKLDPAELEALKNDPAKLTSVLYYHMVLGFLGPDDVHGKMPTQEGKLIDVTGKGGDIKINDTAKGGLRRDHRQGRGHLHDRHRARPGRGAGRQPDDFGFPSTSTSTSTTPSSETPTPSATPERRQRQPPPERATDSAGSPDRLTFLDEGPGTLLRVLGPHDQDDFAHGARPAGLVAGDGAVIRAHGNALAGLNGQRRVARDSIRERQGRLKRGFPGPAGTTLLISPHFNASSAVIGSPVNSISRATLRGNCSTMRNTPRQPRSGRA